MIDDAFKDLVIVKRSGQRVSFNGIKIAVAIKNAFDNVYLNPSLQNINFIYSEVLNYIKENYKERKTINVEDIQDIIENTLKNNNYNEVYEAFNSYRNKRKISRDVFDKKSIHKFVTATEKLIDTTDDFDKPIEELTMTFSNTISSSYAKAYLIDNKYLRSHDEGIIYIDNIDYYLLGKLNSVCVNLFNIDDYDNYFDTISDLLLNLKHECLNISIPSFDYLLEPYTIYNFKNILINNLEYSFKLYGLYDYINFDSLKNNILKLNKIDSYDELNKYLLNDKVKDIFNYSYNYSLDILRNKLRNKIKIFLNKLNYDCYSISIGTNNSYVGKLIYDIYVSNIKDMDRLNIITIFKNNDIKLISNLIYDNKNIAINNINSINNKKYLLDNYKYECEYFNTGFKIGNNVFEKNTTSIGRMVLSSTSINLVRVSLKSANINEFYNNIDNLLDITKNELINNYEYIASKSLNNYKYLFSNNILIDSEKIENNKIRKVIKQGTLNISLVGVYESSIYIKEDYINIIKYISNKIDEFINEFKLNFTLSIEYNTNIIKYFSDIDTSIYGKINNITDKTYKILYDDKINKYLTGGVITLLNINNKNIEKIEKEIKNILSEDVDFIKVNYENSRL